MTLKVKYADFHQITRSRSLSHDIQSRERLERMSLELLSPLTPTEQGIRLLGVTLSALNIVQVDPKPQLSLTL